MQYATHYAHCAMGSNSMTVNALIKKNSLKAVKGSPVLTCFDQGAPLYGKHKIERFTWIPCPYQNRTFFACSSLPASVQDEQNRYKSEEKAKRTRPMDEL